MRSSTPNNINRCLPTWKNKCLLLNLNLILTRIFIVLGKILNGKEDIVKRCGILIFSVKKGRPASGSSVDRRRKVHLKCEHRRRKEIQEALDSLVAELPSTAKARSKAAIIVDSAEMISELTFTLDRLLNENKLLLNRKQVEELTK